LAEENDIQAVTVGCHNSRILSYGGITTAIKHVRKLTRKLKFKPRSCKTAGLVLSFIAAACYSCNNFKF